jgi:GGDEF domain-containing protein
MRRLTGALNRRGMEAVIEREIEAAANTGAPLSLIVSTWTTSRP